jgi:hypothetical protein
MGYSLTVAARYGSLTPDKAKRLRESLKQMRQEQTRLWAEIKRDLGL